MKFRGQALKMARYFARKRVRPQDADDVEWNPASRGSEGMEVRPALLSGRCWEVILRSDLCFYFSEAPG